MTTTRKTNTPAAPIKAPQYSGAHFIVIAITVAVACVSASGAALYVMTMGLDTSLIIPAMVFAALVGFGFDMVSIVAAPVWASAKGFFLKVFGLVLIGGFMVIGGGLQTSAINTLDQMQNATEVTAAQASLATINQKIADQASATELCDPADGTYVGPQRCKERKDGLAEDRLAFTAQQTIAQDVYDAAIVPSVPIAVIAGLAAIFQLVAFFVRAFITTVTNQRQVTLNDAFAAERTRLAVEKAEAKAERVDKAAKKERAKKRAEKKQANRVAEKAVSLAQYTGPYVVAANDR